MGRLLAALLCTASPQQGSAFETLAIRGTVPERVEAIDVVSIEGQAPTVTLHTSRPIPEPRRRRVGESYEDLLRTGDGLETDGPCAAMKVMGGERAALRITATGQGACRIGLALARGGAVLDMLSGTALRLRGEQVSVQSVTLSDRRGRQATAELDRCGGAGPLECTVFLEPLARKLDLREVVSMTLAIPQAPPVAEVHEVGLVGKHGEAEWRRKVGFWLWEYREALADPESVMRACLANGCRRLLLQMPSMTDPEDVWSQYANLLARMLEAGIEAYALDGDPEAAFEPRPLVEKIQRLLSLMGERRLAGVQLDIEPYVLERFVAEGDGFVRYLDAIRQLKAAVRGQVRMSIVMPFWLTSIAVENRPVAFGVMDIADEVAVMTYRTDLDDLQRIADDVLRYGDLVGVPVWLAIETRALPIERHVRLHRVETRRLADAYVDRERSALVLDTPPPSQRGDWFRVVERTTVRSERLSFSDRSQDAVRDALSVLLRRIPHHSLAGILIHDFTGFRMLASAER